MVMTVLSASHPNFPVGLDIAPSSNVTQEQKDIDDFEQADSIDKFGIAGRIW